MSRSRGGSIVHDLAADAHLPGRDVLEAGDHPQRRGLAAARRPDEDDELAVGDLEVELVHGAGSVAVDLRQALELDRSHRRDSCNLVTFAAAVAAVAAPGGAAGGGSGTSPSGEGSSPRS